MRLGNISQLIGQAAVNIIDDIRAETVTVMTHAGAMGGNKIHPAQNLKTVISIGKIRAGIDSRGKMMSEQPGALGKNIPVGAGHRCPAKIRRQHRADAAKVGHFKLGMQFINW